MNPTHRAMLTRFGSNSSLNRAAFTQVNHKLTAKMEPSAAQAGLDALEDAGYIYAIQGGYMLSHAGRIYLDGPGRVTAPRTFAPVGTYKPLNQTPARADALDFLQVESLPMGAQIQKVGMTSYEHLDELIYSRIANGCSFLHGIYYGKVRDEAFRLGELTGRADWRIVDSRLQALRKAGRISYTSKSGWSVTTETEPSTA